DDYLKPGLTYPPRTNKRFAPRVLPERCIFGQKGPSFVDIQGSPWALLAFLNSRPVSYLLSLSSGMSEAEGGAGANSYDPGTLQKLPFPTKVSKDKQLEELGEAAWRTRALEAAEDETTIGFSVPSAIPGACIRT